MSPSLSVPQTLFRQTALILLPLLGLQAPAQITLKASTNSVVSENLCELKLHDPEGGLQAWTWSVLEPGGGTIHTEEDGRVFYTAPAVANPSTFHVRVVANAQLGTMAQLAIQVQPRIEGLPDLLVETLMPKTMGCDWLAPVPRMTLFAGTTGGSPDPQHAVFNGASAIGFLDSDPAMADLNDKWLVGDHEGLKVVSGLGQSRLLPGLPIRLTAIATRPKDSAPANPHHVVVAQSLPGARRHLSSGRISAPTGVVWTLAPDGTTQVLAGNASHDPMETIYRDATGTEARFGYISALAMNAEGDVFVADAGNNLVRKISPAGLVTTVAGNAEDGSALFLSFPFNLCLAADGPRGVSSFGHLRGMTLDPATGCLYLADGNAIRTVTPAGEVTTLLGQCSRSGFEPGPADQPVPLNTPCLGDPDGLHLRGDHLFIADSSNHAIRVFHLSTRILQTVVGHRSQPQLRLGPVGCFSSLPAEGCAALGYPGTLGISPGGSCLVDLPHGLAHVDLHTLAEEGPEQPAAGDNG